MIFDTHAHYDDERFDEDREALLASLPLDGIGNVVNVSANMESVETGLQLARRVSFMYAALGVHPDDTKDLTEADMQRIATLCRENPDKVLAIGEIGLDYYWENTERAIQKKWFERQLQLSNELQFPVIIHSREAAQDTYEIIRAMKTGEGAGIVHCFSYTKEMARQFLDLGYYIGIGGVVTFKNAKAIKEVAAYVPKDRLLLETDAPYLAPTPHRGERNDSRNLKFVVETLSEIRGVTPEEIIKTTEENAKRLYRIED